MQIKITGQEPFQVLSTNFSISPSESGYDLMFSADGFEYSKLFTVGADTNRQVTQVAAGSYYFLSGNTGEVTINWMKDCGGQGGGGGYVLPVASENTLGGVKIGSGITIDENGAISAQGGGGTQYAAGDGIEISGSTISVKAGEGLSFSGDTLIATGGVNTIYVDLSDGSTGAQVYAKIDSAYTAGKEVILRAIDYNFRTNGTQVLLPFSRKNGSDYYFQGSWVQETGSPNFQQYFIKIKSNGTTEGTNTSDNIIYAYRSVFARYSLPTAAANTKGGIKVGSGLTMSEETMSVAIGDGLAFSGNTIVVSGASGGGKETIIINDLDSTGLAALATRLFGYYDVQNDVINYPVDELEIYWWVPDPNYAGGYDDNGYKDYVKVMPVGVEGTEWSQNGMWLSGPFSLGSFEGGNLLRNFRIMILEDGSFVGAGVDAVPIPEIPQIFLSRFGNDERGGLTYDADNDCFYYDSNTIATGDTTNVYEDLIDNQITDWLISGDAPVKNSSMLYVTESGETTEYTHPSVSRKTFQNPVTIDSQDFYKEVTYNYGDWKFTAYYGANDGNNGANLRISRV